MMKAKVRTKILRSALLMMVLSLFLSSCQQDIIHTGNESFTDIEESPVSTNTAEAESDISTPQPNGDVNGFEDFKKAISSLKIQMKGQDNVYDAAKPLACIFVDMLSKVHRVDLDSPEGKKQAMEFDYDQYDFRLKFEGVLDVLLTLKGNVFHFEGDKQLYILWGDSKPLWESLVFDDAKNTVDFNEERIRVMAITQKEDVNSDGEDENIELFYERGKSENLLGDLIISINNKRMTVLKDAGWHTLPYHTIAEMPEIEFQQDSTGKQKVILVHYSWATNGIGFTGVINAYKYNDGIIHEVKVPEAERVIKYNEEDSISVSFPILQREFSVKINKDDFKRYLGEEDTLAELLEDKDAFNSHPFWYLVKDFNGDGQKELCSVSVFRMQTLPLSRLHTYYKYEEGELKPIQAFIFSSYNVDDKKSRIENYIYGLIEMNGYLTICDDGLPDANSYPGYDYKPVEIKEVLDKLLNDKILKLDGNRLYVNY